MASGGLLLLTLCVLLGALDACHADDAVPEDVVVFRGGIPNVFRVLPESVDKRGVERRRMVFFGSDFLFRPGVRAPSPHFVPVPDAAQAKDNSFLLRFVLTCARERVPGARITQSLGTTVDPSWSGAFRLADRGILGRGAFQPEWVDLVVLDFSLGDRNQSEALVLAGMEGMVRQVRRRLPEADILFLYAPNREFLNAYRSGEPPRSIALHEQVAEHYGIPSVNLAKFIADRILSGELSEDEVFLSDTVVSDDADRLCLEVLIPLLRNSHEAAKRSPDVEAHRMPPPLSRHSIDQPSVVSYEVAELGSGWNRWQESPLEHILHIVRCDEPGPELTLRFRGELIALSHIAGPDSGDIEFSLDGSEWARRPGFRANDGTPFRTVPVLLADGLDASVERTLRLRMASGDAANGAGTTLRIVDFLVNGSVEGTEPYAGMTALERIDAVYAEMEPVRYEPSPDRWTYLPRTMRKLEEGPALTMVMLGSSVVGDTGRSNFELRLQRLYPNCAIRKIMSLRGGTGCEYFRGEGRVQQYVLRHDPDLVVIGGMTRGTIPEAMEAIRDVIGQIRAGKPDTEILLLTRTFGRRNLEDPNRNPEWQEFVSPDGTDYRSSLMRLAAEEQVEFLDIHGIWGRYLLDSKYASGSFMRDEVHANPRGQQILGRILERYFAPKQ